MRDVKKIGDLGMKKFFIRFTDSPTIDWVKRVYFFIYVPVFCWEF
jgi:hypothetical protein